MRVINVETINGIQPETVYEIWELPYLRKLLNCKESHKRGITYLEIPCAFDIETTNIYKRKKDGSIETDPRPFAFMYHWQFCLDDKVVFGRTWEEFQKLMRTLEQNLNLSYKTRLVVFVHNLPFEWFYIQRFVEYEEGFFLEEKKPAKILTKGGIEFRCSYILSNMTLNKFCKNESGVIHYKLDGDTYNYDKIRTPTTPMEEYEEAYCYNDVRGLCECISSRMKNDTLATMPMTATGYVRRDLREAVRGNKKYREKFKNNALDPKLYTMCRQAFRGGDTHANINFSNQTIYNAYGKDIASSYPATMIMDQFPSTAFFRINTSTMASRDLSGYALLMHIMLVGNVRYIGQCGIPYIAYSKCLRYSADKITDNGRILKCSYVEMVCTDIDYEIIKNEYYCDKIYIKECYASKYAPLDEPIKNIVMEYYKGKTELKGVDSMKYEYTKKKNLLNSTYGCMVMRIDQEETIFNPQTFLYDIKNKPLEETLEKFYKSRNNFLSYQVGVWITAGSRKRLRRMLNVVGSDVIYCDTDSIKFIGDHEADFEKENAHIIKRAEECGAFAYDRKGNKKYMGVWENDGTGEFSEFRTLGAKKYVYKDAEGIHSTIAGVSKKAGEKYFTEHGVDGFQIGKTIPNSGHLTAFYNPDPIHEITINGDTFTTASNLAIIDNIYTIGVTNEYLDLLEKALAKMEDMDYI